MTDQDAYELMGTLFEIRHGKNWDGMPAQARRDIRAKMNSIECAYPGTLYAIQDAAFCEVYDL